MSEAIVLQFYVVVSALMAGIFLAAFSVLVRKFRGRRDRRHMWAALAFALLAAQEVVVLSWLLGSLPLSERPWHLQQIAVLMSFVLLALAMGGKIRD